MHRQYLLNRMVRPKLRIPPIPLTSMYPSSLATSHTRFPSKHKQPIKNNLFIPTYAEECKSTGRTRNSKQSQTIPNRSNSRSKSNDQTQERQIEKMLGESQWLGETRVGGPVTINNNLSILNVNIEPLSKIKVSRTSQKSLVRNLRRKMQTTAASDFATFVTTRKSLAEQVNGLR